MKLARTLQDYNYVNDWIDIFELNDHQAKLFLSTQIKT